MAKHPHPPHSPKAIEPDEQPTTRIHKEPMDAEGFLAEVRRLHDQLRTEVLERLDALEQRVEQIKRRM